MSWNAPERPRWVQSVNAGDVPAMADVARQPLTVGGLLSESRASAGIDDGGDSDFGQLDDFRTPLEILLAALEDEAELTVLGRWLTRRHLLRLLRVRLQFTRYLQEDPGVIDEQIVTPLVVTGAPRTGTTVLHALLAADPALRAPLGWELYLPVPPPVPGADEQARIDLAEGELRGFAGADPGLDAIHEYGARNPKECLSAMSFAFLSEEFVVRYHVPTYTNWLASCDMRPAYDYHRLVLALLQRRSDPRPQWVLKTPVHLHSLGTLLDVYPDARIAVTHRDPLAVLGSVSSLVAHLRWVHSDHVDLAEIGRYHAELYGRSLNALVNQTDPRLLEPGRVHMGGFAELTADPVDAAAACYETWGQRLTDSARAKMVDYVAARPRGRHGTHEYSFDELGLDASAERARFAPYTRKFAVPKEVQ